MFPHGLTSLSAWSLADGIDFEGGGCGTSHRVRLSARKRSLEVVGMDLKGYNLGLV